MGLVAIFLLHSSRWVVFAVFFYSKNCPLIHKNQKPGQNRKLNNFYLKPKTKDRFLLSASIHNATRQFRRVFGRV